MAEGDGNKLANDIENDYEDGWWGGNEVDDGKVGGWLERFEKLDSTEFAAAVEDMDGDAKQSLIDEAGNFKDDDKYKPILDAIDKGPDSDEYKNYVNNLTEDETEADKAKFEDEDGTTPLAPEGDMLAGVALHRPQGASEDLQALIKDTEWTMQTGFDTLGAGNPKAAPGFSNQLDGTGVESAEGWAQIVDGANDLNGALTERQTKFDEKHKNVDADAFKSDLERDKTFLKLVEIKDTLNEHLKKDLSSLENYAQLDDKIIYNDDPQRSVGFELYEKDPDSEKGYFVLTPEAEHRFYVQHIETATEDWETEYAKAKENLQRVAESVDNDDPPPDDTDNPPPADNNNPPAGNNNPPAGNNNPPPAGNNNPPPADTNTDTATEDFSKTYEDLFGKEESPAEKGEESGGEEKTGASPLEELLKPIRDAITGGGGDAGSGQNAAAAPAAAGGGGDMMSMMMPMMMMSMMSQMMQQITKKKDDESDRREEEEREREDEGPQAAPAPGPAAAPPAPAQPASTAPPAPADPGPPPAENTPKSMVDMKLPDGSTQRVSSVIAEAMNKELNNPNGSDARAAYQGTAGEATAGSPWNSVESTAVATGDIAQWENRSALVVVTDAGLQAIVNGELVPLDPHNPPDGGQGGYGEFRGFFHPSGADISGTNEMPAAGAPPEPPAVSTAQPPAAPAAPPTVAPPATMEVR